VPRVLLHQVINVAQEPSVELTRSTPMVNANHAGSVITVRVETNSLSGDTSVPLLDQQISRPIPLPKQIVPQVSTVLGVSTQNQVLNLVCGVLQDTGVRVARLWDTMKLDSQHNLQLAQHGELSVRIILIKTLVPKDTFLI
jgi:hypothetical protein